MARRHLYASRMALIQVAEKNNQPDRIVQLLRSLIPENGEQEDLRDFEWNFLWRKYHGEHSQFKAHSGAITSIASSPDEKWFATASKDHTIKIWDAITLKEIQTLNGHTQSVNDIAVSSDSHTLVSVSSDNSLRIWNLKSGADTRVLDGHDDPIQSVALSSDGEYIASGDKKGRVIVWEIVSGQKANQFLHAEMVTGLSFQPKNNLVIACPGSVQTRDPFEDSATENVFTDKISSKVAFHPSGYKLAFGVADRLDKSASIKARDFKDDKSGWTVDRRVDLEI